MRSRVAGGFTLIEVLVAAFVLAVGVMGALAAQTVALRTRAQSALMSHGVQLATSFADRMRANTAQMRAPDNANPYLNVRYDSAFDGVPAQPRRMCRFGAACDSAQLASFDVHEMQREMHASFPRGRVLVCRDAVVWDAARGSLSWDCSGGPADPPVIKLGWHHAGDTDNAGAAPMVALAVPAAGMP